jgi:sec-independent protein translocase protein TatB
MLPEIGATELLVIAAVALIVVGPKDLPMLLRKLGGFVARLRGMASEFRNSFDDMARQSELDDLRREVAAMRDTASAETQAVATTINELNSEVDMSNALYSPDYEGSIGYDADQALRQEQAAAEAKPAAKPKAKAAPKAKPVAPQTAAPQTAAPKARAPKLTVSKIEPPPAPKAAKPLSPRKAST